MAGLPREGPREAVCLALTMSGFLWREGTPPVTCARPAPPSHPRSAGLQASSAPLQPPADSGECPCPQPHQDAAGLRVTGLPCLCSFAYFLSSEARTSPRSLCAVQLPQLQSRRCSVLRVEGGAVQRLSLPQHPRDFCPGGVTRSQAVSSPDLCSLYAGEPRLGSRAFSPFLPWVDREEAVVAGVL